MPNLIPHFIAEQYTAQNTKGTFRALTMFVDISGFSNLTETLMQHGKEGAEILNVILSAIFEPVVAAVYQRSGFVSGFAGDALTAVFPYNRNLIEDLRPSIRLDAIYAANAINQVFAEHGLQHTKFGDFELSVKIGLDVGQVDWGIVGSEIHKTWFFRGDAIDGCAHAEHQCQRMDIVLTRRLVEVLTKLEDSSQLYARFTATPIDKNYSQLGSVLEPEDQFTPVIVPAISRDVSRLFLPDAVLDYQQGGEFRQIASVFLSFREPDTFDELSDFAGRLILLVDSYDGYLETLDFGDKGGNSLIIFGAPTAHEKITNRALHFILDLKRRMGNRIRAGVTYGLVFAGIHGGKERAVYRVLGSVVNLSAQLMMKADWGDIWLDRLAAERSGMEFLTQSGGEYRFKGFSQPLSVVRLRGLAGSNRLNVYEQALVGRDAELQQLKAFVQPMLERAIFCGLLTVYGGAGMGKSRLVDELHQLLRQTDAVTWCDLPCNNIRGGGFHPFKHFMFSTFHQSREKSREANRQQFEADIQRLVDQLSALPETPIINQIVKELNRTQSMLLALVDIIVPGSLYEQLEPRLRHENTISALINLFQAFGQLKPVVICIDDIQWIDEESMSLLTHLTGYFYLTEKREHRSPLAIICTSRYRDDGSCPQLEVAAGIPIQRIDLNMLNRVQIQELAQAVVNAPLDRAVIDFLVKKTAGNPFYIEQILQDLQSRQALAPMPDSETLTTAAKDMDAIPSTINELLIARLDRLTQQVKELVQTAAVIGDEFESAFLLAVINCLGPEQDYDELDARLAAGEKEMIWKWVESARYIFRHVLFREAAYDMQLRARLRKLHQIIAETIERLNPNTPVYYAALAHHYERSEIWDKACIYYLWAGDNAKDAFNNSESLSNYQSALGLLDKTEPGTRSKREIDIRLAAVAIYDRTAKRDMQEENLNIALRLAKHIGDRSKEVDILEKCATLYCTTGQYDRSREFAEKGRQLAQTIRYRRGEAVCLKDIGRAYIDADDFGRGLFLLEQALPLFREIGYQKGEADCLNLMGAAHARSGNCGQAFVILEQALAISRRENNIVGEGVCLGTIASAHYYSGDYEQALIFQQKDLSIAIEIGDRRSEAISLDWLGVIYLAVGDYGQALAFYEQVLPIYREIRDRKAEATCLRSIGLTYYQTADYSRALVCLEQSLNICQESGIQWSETESRIELGKTLILLEKQDQAAEQLRRAGEIANSLNDKENQLRSWSWLGVAWLKAVPELALAYSEQAIRLLADAQRLNEEPIQQMWFNHYLALSAAGREEEAATALQKAYHFMIAEADKISGSTMRQRYLEQVPVNRDIAARIDRFQQRSDTFGNWSQNEK